LHTAQKEPAWHGGTITKYRAALAPEGKRKIFTYLLGFDFNVICPVAWAQESAVAWWSEDRTTLLTQAAYLKALKSN
jgi:hypothetical protein